MAGEPLREGVALGAKDQSKALVTYRNPTACQIIQPECFSVASVTGGSVPVTGGSVAEGPPGALAGPGAGARGSLPPSRLRLSMLLLLMHRGKLGAGLEI